MVAAVLAGNRNFEGRIHPLVRANYLASPPLVVAYALAGTVDIDLSTEPIGNDPGRPAGLPARHLADASEEVAETMERASRPEMLPSSTATSSTATRWRAIPAPEGAAIAWAPDSTYIQEPPFFADLAPEPRPP